MSVVCDLSASSQFSNVIAPFQPVKPPWRGFSVGEAVIGKQLHHFAGSAIQYITVHIKLLAHEHISAETAV